MMNNHQCAHMRIKHARIYYFRRKYIYPALAFEFKTVPKLNTICASTEAIKNIICAENATESLASLCRLMYATAKKREQERERETEKER